MEQEIIRLNRTPSLQGESLDLEVNDPYGNIPDWRDAITLMARGVVRTTSPTLDDEQCDFQAGLLLRQAAMALPTDAFVVEALGLSEDTRHPGEIDPPGKIEGNTSAREVLRVWSVPGDSFHIAGDTDAISHEDLGDVLSQIVQRHALLASQGDSNLELKMIARVQKDFMTRFDIGRTRQ